MLDSIRRTDLKQPTHFETFSAATQKALVKAATSGSAELTSEQFDEIALRINVPSWLMVPTRKGDRQVAVIYRLAYVL